MLQFIAASTDLERAIQEETEDEPYSGTVFPNRIVRVSLTRRVSTARYEEVVAQRMDKGGGEDATDADARTFQSHMTSRN